MSRGRARDLVPTDEHRERRDHIVAVAMTVLRERGYGAGSLDAIAAALGLRKASLCYYVHSKSDLLTLVFDRAITDALR